MSYVGMIGAFCVGLLFVYLGLREKNKSKKQN